MEGLFQSESQERSSLLFLLYSHKVIKVLSILVLTMFGTLYVLETVGYTNYLLFIQTFYLGVNPSLGNSCRRFEFLL